MIADWIVAIATAGTFIVISASAVAALIQLRHTHAGNQIAALTEVRETMGSKIFVKNGILNADVVCDLWSHLAIRNWNAMEPIITNRRRLLQNPGINENFEYIAAISTRWLEKHPSGAYPRNVPRMPQSHIWPEHEHTDASGIEDEAAF